MRFMIMHRTTPHWEAGAIPGPFARGKHTVTDGPFTESKELIAGYVIVEAPSLREAMKWAPLYGAAVGCPELDLRPVAGST